MTPNSIARNRTAAVAQNMNVRIPDDFVEGAQYVPIASLATVNGAREPAISQYLNPPSSGTFVLGSINGSIQWIATEDCD